MKKLFLLLVLAGTLATLTGCRTYCGYRTEEKWEYRKVVSSDSKYYYQLKNIDNSICLQHCTDTTTQYRDDKYKITYTLYTNNHLGIYLGHTLLSPFTFLIAILPAEQFKEKTVQYRDKSYTYTAVRQWWNMFWIFNDVFDPENKPDGIEESKSLSDSKYYTRVETAVKDVENCELEVEIPGQDDIEVPNKISIANLRRRVFDYAYPARNVVVKISAKKETLLQSLNSLDMLSAQDIAWLENLPAIYEQECFTQQTELLAKLAALKNDRLLAENFYNSSVVSVKQRAESHRQLINKRLTEMETERLLDRAID